MKKFLWVFIVLNILLLLFYITNKYNSVSLQVNDLYYKFNTHKSSNKVVFVEIGEKSINKYGRWPWDRKVLAELINKINTKVILLDIVFSEPTDNDRYLSSVLSEKPAVCGFFLREKATERITQNQLDLLSDSVIDANGEFLSGRYAEVNVQTILQSCMLNGVLSTFSDSDNIFRHYIVAYEYQGMIFPSLGLQGLRLYFNRDFDIKNHTLYYFDKKIKLNKKNALKLNFYKRNNYHVISIEDAAKYDLKDKIAIIGISEIGISDIRSTPIGQIPGPLIHYTFISNLLNGDYIRQYDTVDFIIVLFFMILPYLMYIVTKDVIARYTTYTVSAVFFVILSILLYKEFNIQLDLFFPLLYLIINILFVEFLLFLQKEQKEKFIKDAFSNYLSKDLLNEIMNNPEKLKLGGEEKELTLLFLDIRNFTSIAEKLTPQEVVKLINTLFSPFSDIIQNNKGMVDKYVGDAIMAMFNAPVDVENHADMACKSAVEIIEKLDELNSRLDMNIQIGIGINTDKVYVGNMGSEKRFNYTAIGDGVNLASRLESKTKELKCKILISEKTYNKINKDLFQCEYIGEISVKGKEERIKVYCIYGLSKN